MNEKKVFFALCKAVRSIQNNFGGETKKIKIDYSLLNIQLKSDNPNKVFALCYKLQEMGLIKVVKDGHRNTTFLLDVKGINYISTLRGAKNEKGL